MLLLCGIDVTFHRDSGVNFEDYGAYDELDIQFEAPSASGPQARLSPSPSQGAPSTSQVTLVGSGLTPIDASRTSRIPHGTQGTSQRRVEIRGLEASEQATVASTDPLSIAQAKGKTLPKPRRVRNKIAARSDLAQGRASRGPMTRARSRSLSAIPAVERSQHPEPPPLPSVGEDADAEEDEDDDAAVEIELFDSLGNANTEFPRDRLDVDDRRTYQRLQAQAWQGSSRHSSLGAFCFPSSSFPAHI